MRSTRIDERQIAALATVSRGDVRAWRTRHHDFPVADSNDLFDLVDVERWLIENGRADQTVSAERMVALLADELRTSLGIAETTRLMAAILVYLEACKPTTFSIAQRAVEPLVDSEHTWAVIRTQPVDILGEKLADAAVTIEANNPQLADLLVPGLSGETAVDGAVLRSLIDTLDAAAETGSRRSLLEDVLAGSRAASRPRRMRSTSESMLDLMIRLTQPESATVLDLACGEGDRLVAAAMGAEPSAAGPTRFVGFDIDPASLRIARSRFFLAGHLADLRLDDAFGVDDDSLPKCDLVLLDPPGWSRQGDDADAYLKRDWPFGAPSRRPTDFGWLQLAVQCLTPSGRAIVVTSAGATNRGSSDLQVRRAMLQAGVIEAVIRLPLGLRDSMLSQVLWLLRSPTASAEDVWFIDASTLGKPGRSSRSLHDHELDRIATAVRLARAGAVPDPAIAWSVGIERLVDGDVNLDPARHRPIDDFDADASLRRAQELRAAIPSSADETGQVVWELISLLEGGAQSWRQ